MCGIVGFINAEDGPKGASDLRKYIEQAIVANTLRGDDSTGMFWQPKKANVGTANWYKRVGDGYGFTCTEKFQRVAPNADDYWFMVGHGRSATIGTVNVDNAHPFQEGDVTLVHNGTLRTTHRLPVPLSKLDDVDVDSHALCHNLALTAPEDVKGLIGKIDGAFTLVWHDARDKSLNIIRNSERPLHIAQSSYSNALYFASEAGLLHWMNERIKLALGDIMFPEPGRLLKFKMGSLEPEVIDCPLEVGRVYSTGRWYGNQWVSWEEDADDDDYAYAACMGGVVAASEVRRSQAPKMEPLPQDNRVLLGGRRRLIPDMAQDLLLEENLVIEDRIQFTPVSTMQKKAGWSVVLGHLDTLGLTAVIYHIQTMTAEASMDRRWMVRPVAIKYTDRARTQPIVVCQLVGTVSGPEEIAGLVGSKAAKPSEEPASSTSDETPSSIDNFLGPNHKYVSMDEFIELTDNGCAFCGDPIFPHQSADIIWYDDEYPLCPPCSTKRINDFCSPMEDDRE